MFSFYYYTFNTCFFDGLWIFESLKIIISQDPYMVMYTISRHFSRTLDRLVNLLTFYPLTNGFIDQPGQTPGQCQHWFYPGFIGEFLYTTIRCSKQSTYKIMFAQNVWSPTIFKIPSAFSCSFFSFPTQRINSSRLRIQTI